MTRTTTKARVRVNLDDAGVTFYTPVDLEDSLQDGYDEIVTASACIEKTFQLTLAANTVYYDLKSLIPDYYYATKIFYPVINRFLDLTDARTLDRSRLDWELWYDNPYYWFPHSWNMVAIVPMLRVVGGQTVNVFYKALAGQEEIFNIPLEGQYLPEYYGTADLLEQCQEYSKANTYWKQYQKDLLGQLKKMNRGLPDQQVRLMG